MVDDFTVGACRPSTDFLARRRMVFLMAYAGYAACYLVRNNVAVVSDRLTDDLGWTSVQVGEVLAAFAISYGIGKLGMGALVDQLRLRHAFAGALGLSAVLCLTMSFLREPASFAVVLALIGLVQGACAPAALALIGAWYPLADRGGRVAVWNTSQNVGAGLLPLLVSGGAALVGPNDWTVGFWLPGLVALVFAIASFRLGGNRPWQEGMPTLRQLFGPSAQPQVNVPPDVSYWRLVAVHVLGNRTLALLSLLNALLYLIRFGIVNWIPIDQTGSRGLSTHDASLVVSAIEWGAIPGALVFSWVAIRWPDRTAAAAAVGLAILAVLVVAFAAVDEASGAIALAVPIGALIYGPQVIVNIITIVVVSPRAVGVAVGWVGLGGYLVGAVTANLTLPRIADATSWTTSLLVLAATTLACVAICVQLRGHEWRAHASLRP